MSSVALTGSGPNRRVQCLAVCVLLGLFCWQSLSAARRHSQAFDEVAHLVSGYSYWKFHEYRFQPENGNLPQRLAGLLPALAGEWNWPPMEKPDEPRMSSFQVGFKWLFQSGNDADELLNLGRLGVISAGVALGLLVFFWSRRLFGGWAGLLSLSLYSFCPTMLAHGAMITSDVTAALFFLLSSWTFWRLLERITWGRLLAAGASLAGLCLSKYSAPLFAPMAGIAVIIRMIDPSPLTCQLGNSRRTYETRLHRLGALAIAFLGLGLLIWAAIWAAYGFRYSATAIPISQRPIDPFVLSWGQLPSPSVVAGRVIEFFRRRHLLPEGYLYGLQYTLTTAQVRQAFAAGHYSVSGWWWFFPYAFLIKTPLSIWAMMALAAGRALRSSPDNSARLARMAPVLPLCILLIVYWAAAMMANLNIGHRHILLTYPAIHILCGSLAPAILARSKPLAIAVSILLAGLMGESWAIRPHYLSFFNIASGGPRSGYRMLVDSSLDWGQDLPLLKQWLDRNAADPRIPIYLSYFGSSVPDHYGIRYRILPSFTSFISRNSTRYFAPVEPGYYCISATHFQSVYMLTSGPWSQKYEKAYWKLKTIYQSLIQSNHDPADFSLVPPADFEDYQFFAVLRWARICAYLRGIGREPDAMAGYSILIFKLSEDDLRQALEGPMPRDPLISPD